MELKSIAASFAAAAAAIGAAINASATTYYVKPDGNDSAAGTSWETALRTPAAGIEKIKAGSRNHELVISNGVYALADALGLYGGEGNSRALIRGATGHPEDVVLDAQGRFEVLRLSANVTVADLTIANGSNYGRSNYASGVRIGDAGENNQSYLSIVSNCVIRGCHNAYTNGNSISGGAAYVFGNGLLVDCVVSNNTATYRGSGVALHNANATALRCLVAGNVATNASGSGAAVLGVGGGTLIDCTVSGNLGSCLAGGLDISLALGCVFDGNVLSPDYSNRPASALGVIHRRIAATNCTFSANVATTGNTTIDIDYGGSVFSNCRFVGNTAKGNGGAVGFVPSMSYPDRATLFHGCLFENNTAANFGGAVSVDTAAKVVFDGCRFFGNRTTADNTSSNEDFGGGAIFLKGQVAGNGSWCTITNCVFGGNESSCRGGAFGATWNGVCMADIVDSVFTNNVSRRQGGAISIREQTARDTNGATIRNCLVANNRTTLTTADSNGGGILLVTRAPVRMENCTIVSNVTSYANSGGVHQRWGGTLVNCIIAFNKRTSNGELKDEVASGTTWSDASGTFLNCLSYPNMTAHLTAANGCVNADPGFTDIANGDFTLAENSPCINKGRSLAWMDGATDLSGLVRRISGSAPDIGAYERFIPEAFTIVIR